MTDRVPPFSGWMSSSQSSSSIFTFQATSSAPTSNRPQYGSSLFNIPEESGASVDRMEETVTESTSNNTSNLAFAFSATGSNPVKRSTTTTIATPSSAAFAFEAGNPTFNNDNNAGFAFGGSITGPGVSFGFSATSASAFNVGHSSFQQPPPLFTTSSTQFQSSFPNPSLHDSEEMKDDDMGVDSLDDPISTFGAHEDQFSEPAVPKSFIANSLEQSTFPRPSTTSSWTPAIQGSFMTTGSSTQQNPFAKSSSKRAMDPPEEARFPEPSPQLPPPAQRAWNPPTQSAFMEQPHSFFGQSSGAGQSFAGATSSTAGWFEKSNVMEVQDSSSGGGFGLGSASGGGFQSGQSSTIFQNSDVFGLQSSSSMQNLFSRQSMDDDTQKNLTHGLFQHTSAQNVFAVSASMMNTEQASSTERIFQNQPNATFQNLTPALFENSASQGFFSGDRAGASSSVFGSQNQQSFFQQNPSTPLFQSDTTTEAFPAYSAPGFHPNQAPESQTFQPSSVPGLFQAATRSGLFSGSSSAAESQSRPASSFFSVNPTTGTSFQNSSNRGFFGNSDSFISQNTPVSGLFQNQENAGFQTPPVQTSRSVAPFTERDNQQTLEIYQSHSNPIFQQQTADNGGDEIFVASSPMQIQTEPLYLDSSTNTNPLDFHQSPAPQEEEEGQILESQEIQPDNSESQDKEAQMSDLAESQIADVNVDVESAKEQNSNAISEISAVPSEPIISKESAGNVVVDSEEVALSVTSTEDSADQRTEESIVDRSNESEASDDEPEGIIEDEKVVWDDGTEDEIVPVAQEQEQDKEEIEMEQEITTEEPDTERTKTDSIKKRKVTEKESEKETELENKKKLSTADQQKRKSRKRNSKSKSLMIHDPKVLKEWTKKMADRRKEARKLAEKLVQEEMIEEERELISAEKNRQGLSAAERETVEHERRMRRSFVRELNISKQDPCTVDGLSIEQVEELLPVVDSDDYYYYPTIHQLKEMVMSQGAGILKDLPGFVIGRKGHGKITFDMPMDVTKLRICKAIGIHPGHVSFFDESSRFKDIRMTITLYTVFCDVSSSVRKYTRERLEEYCAQTRSMMKGYDEEGTWVFTIEGINSEVYK